MSRCESCAKVPLTMPSIVAATKVALPSMCLSVAALELETNILYGNNGCQWDQMEESIARRVERPASTYPWEMFFGSSSPCDVGIEKRGPKLISLPHVHRQRPVFERSELLPPPPLCADGNRNSYYKNKDKHRINVNIMNAVNAPPSKRYRQAQVCAFQQ